MRFLNRSECFNDHLRPLEYHGCYQGRLWEQITSFKTISISERLRLRAATHSPDAVQACCRVAFSGKFVEMQSLPSRRHSRMAWVMTDAESQERCSISLGDAIIPPKDRSSPCVQGWPHVLDECAHNLLLQVVALSPVHVTAPPFSSGSWIKTPAL